MSRILSKATIAKRASAPEPSEETKALALVMLDAALAKVQRIFREHDDDGLAISDDRRTFVDRAHTEYMRRFPRCTDVPNGLIVQEREGFVADDPDPERARRGRTVRKVQWQMVCLFCRESMQTLGAEGRTLPPEWWAPLHFHTLECAARFVLGELDAPKPKAWQLAKDDPKEPKKKKKKSRRERKS